VEQQIPGLDEPAADDDQRAVQDRQQVADAERHPVGEVVEDGERVGVALGRGPADVFAADQLGLTGQLDAAGEPVRHRRLAAEEAEPAARREPLPAPLAAARARRPVRVDHHVARLAAESVRPAHQLAFDDGARPDAGAERDQHRIPDPPGGAGHVLAPGGAGGVVVDPDREAQAGLQLVAHPHAEQAGQVGSDPQDPAPVDQTGDADADRADLLVLAQRAHDVRDGVEHRHGPVGSRYPRLVDHRRGVVGVERDTQHLRATGVDAGDERPGQYRSRAPARPITSRSALPMQISTWHCWARASSTASSTRSSTSTISCLQVRQRRPIAASLSQRVHRHPGAE
jgi:hypothetical protein